jgi:hypothetical protein
LECFVDTYEATSPAFHLVSYGHLVLAALESFLETLPIGRPRGFDSVDEVPDRLRQLMLDAGDRTNMHRRVMANHVIKVWRACSDSHLTVDFPDPARAVLPLINMSISKLSILVKSNYTTHFKTYSQLIAESRAAAV